MQKMNCYASLNDFNSLLNIRNFLVFEEIIKQLLPNNNIEYIAEEVNLTNLFSNPNIDKQINKELCILLDRLNYSSKTERELEKEFYGANFYKQYSVLGFPEILHIKFPRLYIKKIEDIIEIKTQYLKQLDDIRLLYDELNNNYNNLLFTGEHNMKSFSEDDIPEIVDAIYVLNKEGMKTFIEKKRDAGEAIKVLNKYFLCSGANDTKQFRKKIVYKEKEYTLVCNPHIKFNRQDSDKRLYFSWGNDEIAKIIVFYIGTHDGMDRIKKVYIKNLI